MIIHTRSATQLERVMIEPSSGGKAHVWLRRNITESTEEFEGQPVQVWDADEVYYLADETPTLDEVEAQFAQLWDSTSRTASPSSTRCARASRKPRRPSWRSLTCSQGVSDHGTHLPPPGAVWGADPGVRPRAVAH